MIKKYNDFLKGKTNEEFVMAPSRSLPGQPEIEVPTRPTTKPLQEPLPPSVIPDHTERDAPAKAFYGEDEELNGEVEGRDTFTDKLEELSDLLPGSKIESNKVIYKGVEIVFPSETFNSETGEGTFHLNMDGKKKKFKTPQEVVDYLKGSSSQTDLSLDGEISLGKRNPSRESDMDEDDMSQWNKNNPHAPSKEDMDELMDAHDEDDFIKDEEEKLESKSYKAKRFRNFK